MDRKLRIADCTVEVNFGGGKTFRANTPDGKTSVDDVTVELEATDKGAKVFLTAGSTPVECIKIDFPVEIKGKFRALHDAWERGYSELCFDSLSMDKKLPWYTILHNEDTLENIAYGVKVRPNAFCSFAVSAEKVELCCDVHCGGDGVILSGRRLEVCEYINEEYEGISAFAAGRRFCALMCTDPVLAKKPVYGSNNWYYAYGHSSDALIKRDTDLLYELCEGIENRPYMVIDDGWSVNRCGGPWNRTNGNFEDMKALASYISDKDILPGIWFRPLCDRSEKFPSEWRLRNDRITYDPSVPAVIEKIEQDVGLMKDWGYKLIKHDFTCNDTTKRWGRDMASSITDSGWHYADRSRTTAEIILDMYRAIKKAAGDIVIIGCNTYSHLSAGIFEANRTGDDTSGRSFRRTVKYGVNTLAFRLIQNNIFYAADADCVGITGDIPWENNREWLNLLAESGSPLFVSPSPDAVTDEMKKDLHRAFEINSRQTDVCEPLDWLWNYTPNRWIINGTERHFSWKCDC